MIRRWVLLVAVVMLTAACGSLQAAVTVQSAGLIGGDADPHADTSVTLPSHATGDLFILMAFVRDADDTASITVASGWSTCPGTFPVDRGTSARYWCWYKFATSASETNPTIDWSGTTGDAYWVVNSYRGVGSLGNNGTATTGTSDPETHSTINTSVANSMVVLAEMGEDNNNAACTTTGTNPADYTEHYDETTTGADAMVCFSDAIRTTAGATGTVSLDFGTAVPVGWGGVLIELKPPGAQVGDVAVSLGNSPAVTAVRAMHGNAAVSLANSCPVCIDFAQPSAAAVAMGVSPVVGIVTGKLGISAVSLGISPASATMRAMNAPADVALGISPSVSAFAPKSSPVDVALGISPAVTSVLSIFSTAAVSMGISPDATADAETPGGGSQVGDAAVALGISPAIGAFAPKDVAPSAAIEIAVSATATPFTPGTRKRSVTVVFIS